MTEKEEKELDEKIDRMAVEMEKEMDEREKEMEEMDKEANQLLKEVLIEINTPFCHYVKPNGQLGKEFVIENSLLRHYVGCNDETQCWNYDQLKDLIEVERKTFLNQDY